MWNLNDDHEDYKEMKKPKTFAEAIIKASKLNMPVYKFMEQFTPSKKLIGKITFEIEFEKEVKNTNLKEYLRRKGK